MHEWERPSRAPPLFVQGSTCAASLEQLTTPRPLEQSTRGFAGKRLFFSYAVSQEAGREPEPSADTAHRDMRVRRAAYSRLVFAYCMRGYSTCSPSTTNHTDTSLSLSLSLSHLPTSIHMHTFTHRPDVSNNDLTEFPPGFTTGCGKLVKLNASENELIGLPDDIGNLADLQTLQCFRNQLSDLPESLGFLDKLHTLDLSVNRIVALPYAIGGCTNLTKLDFSWNKVEVLPEGVGTGLVKVREKQDPLSVPRPPETQNHSQSCTHTRAHTRHTHTHTDSLCRLTRRCSW